MRVALLLASLFAVADLGPSCGPSSKECGLVSCTDGFRLSIRPKTSLFGVGTYGVDLNPGSGNVHFECTLSNVAADSLCTLTAGSTSTITAEIVTEPGNSSITFNFSDLPTQVSVNVTRAGAVVGTGTFTPSYFVATPNGASCAPSCQQATASLSVESQ